MINCNIFENFDVAILYNNETIECLKLIGHEKIINSHGLLPYNFLLQKIKHSNNSVKDIIINTRNVGFWDLSEIECEKIFYVVWGVGEFYPHKTPFCLSKQFENQKNYIVIEYPLQKVIDLYSKNNIKILHSFLGFYGKFAQQSLLPQTEVINPKVFYDLNKNNIEKISQLKKFNNILWCGRMHYGRKQTIDLLKQITPTPYKIIIPDPINLNIYNYADYLIQNNCFCALSLDGTTAQCNRDTELGLAKIPIIKYTSLKTDISINKNMYLARNEQEYINQINNLKMDLETNQFTKIENIFLFMSNLNFLITNNKINCLIETILNRKKINYLDFLIKNQNMSISLWDNFIKTNISFTQ